MPALSGGQTTKLQGENHVLTPYLSVLKQRVLWTARVNSGALSQGDTAIPFDAGSGSYFSLVEEYQEVWVGTTAGGEELGRARIRGISSGDSGVTGTVTVARCPVVWQDNAYLTFVHDYPLRPLRPRIDTNEVFYKDYDVTFSWPPTPVCVAGPHRAEWLSGSSLVFNVDLSNSYAIASGATIVSFTASVAPSTGVTVSVNGGTGLGTITFTQAGQYWAKFTCTDSNGKTETTYRCYFAASTDPDNAYYPAVDFEVGDLNGVWSSGGWDCSVSLKNSPTLADVPDRTLVVLWGDWSYDDVSGPVGFGPDNNSAILIGYVRQDSYSKDMGTGEQPVNFKITTAHGVLGQKYNFSVSLEAVNGTPDTWWKYDASLTVGRGIHHLLAEHTTALQCMDIIGLTGITTRRAFVEIADNDMYGAGDNLASQRGTREHLICDRYGRTHFVPNQQTLPDADRAGLVTVGTVSTTDRSLLEINREQENQVCYTHVSGFVWDGTFDADGVPNAQPVCAIAPGDDPYEDGPKVERMEYQTFASQQEANDVAGRVQSAANNRYKELEVAFHGNYLGVVEPANGEQWEISLLSTETPRGIVVANLPIYPRVAQVSISDGVVVTTVTFEAEAPPLDGKTTDCPTLPPLGGIPEIPDEGTLGGALATAGSVRYKSPLGVSWASRYGSAVSDMAADPYWQSKQSSDASEDAILVIGGPGYIRRSVDAGNNWTVVTPSTDPPNAAGDDPAPTAADLDYAVVEPNEAVESEWLVVGRWQNANDEWRSWIVYTDDDFTTRSWAPIGTGSGGPYTVDSANCLQPEQLTQTGQKIAVLNDTDFVIAYRKDSGGFDALHARVGRVSGFNVEFGTITILGDVKTIRSYRMVAMDSTTLLVLYDYDTAFDADVKDVFSCTISDLEFSSIGARTNVLAGSGSLLQLERLTSTKAIMTVCARPSNGFAIPFGYYTRTINVSGDTITSLGTAFTAKSSSQIVRVDLCVISATKVLSILGIRYTDSTSRMTVHGQILTITGDVITEGTSSAATMSETSSLSAAGCWMGSVGLAVAEIKDVNLDSYVSGWVVLVSGTTVTFNSEGVIVPLVTAEHIDPIVSALSSTGAMITYTLSDGVDFASVTVNATVTSALTVSPNSESEISNAVALSGEPYHGVVGGRMAVGYINSAGTQGPMMLYIQGIPGLGKVLGMSIGKAEGLLVYLTSWDGLEVAVQIYELPAFTQIDDVYLSAATEAQLNSRQIIAFPYLPNGFSDDFAWIYGRMQDPAGLTGLSHVIYTLDAGLSFQVLEDGLGSYHVSSLVELYGTVQAMVSSLTQSKLYTGNLNGISLKSTLPVPGYIYPHGQTYDWLDQIIYAASGVAGAVVVVKSASPYSDWVDITYDHGATAVKSIIIL